ncbi:MAG TPA: WYL domain-containing protein, partial [Anaerolineae bacterium]|nr:WYL domain-containing protein [Anaerolineae bacterium]
VEEVRALVEEALERGGVLEMAYYTAGRDEVTHRVVEPYRLERRGEVLYLVGFCRRAQAERLFRLDRIRQIVVREGDAAA